MVLERVMVSYLRAIAADPGPGLSRVPLEGCARELGLDGLALLLRPRDSSAELVQSFGEHTTALEDLQRTQGQGPSLDAAEYGMLMLLPNLSDPTAFAPTRWPGLPGAIEELGVGAVFAFPLRIGVIALGALTGHRTRPGPLSPDELADAFGLTDTLAQAIISQAAWTDPPEARLLDEPGLHFAEVHQATGMLSAQMHISCAQALIRLRSYAFSHNRSLLTTARDVLGHRLRLDNPDEPWP
ncbi:ANTAR domain-containing protein [Streptomyces sp. CC224B]|uniref:ANTAR domain-containing protein n=1 Tax=Streptomyces sp. CC224B TaxID=3044571 RepID=UPI0024A928CE|nr:ANTAR domain-containing protein [Streptomyces sp. CC224B]